MALSEADQERARYHLAYSSISTPVSLSLGDVTITQARFIIDRHLAVVKESAEPLLIRTLDRLDCIEKEMDTVSSALVTSQVGTTKFRDDALEQLEGRYRRYQERLADMLASMINPVSNEILGNRGAVVEGNWF